MISDLIKLWDGSEEGSVSLQQGSVTDSYKLAHSKLSETVNQLLQGQVHSDYSNLYVRNVSWGKLGNADSSGGGPEDVKLKITYETLSSGNGDPPPIVQNSMGDWLETWNAAGETITIGEGFEWQSDAYNLKKAIKDEDISAVKILRGAAFSLTGTTDRFDSDAKTFVLNTQGKINKTNITIKGYTYSADHLLFESFSSQEGKDIFGSDVHTLTWNFVHKPDNTWNQFWDKNALGAAGNAVPNWREVKDENGKPPYTSAPFSDIDPANWT